MFNLLKFARKSLRKFALVGATLALAACDVTLSGGGDAPDGPVTVALLVPYGSSTPGDTEIARSLENAARLAVADLGGKSVNLKVYNTAGSASTAAAMANKAAAEGASVILGPLRADAANAAAVAVSDDNLNVLAFSNNTSIAGGNLFILGNTFENTASRLLRYAGAQGRTRIVVVHPRTPVGQIARNAIVNASKGTPVSIVGDGAFDFSQEGIVAAVPRIASTIQSSGATGVFITSDSTGALPLLAQLLPERGVSPSVTKYLGLTRWDRPSQTLGLKGLQGGWFALPDPSANAKFVERYRGAHGGSPHVLAALAYDGIAAIGSLASKGKAVSGSNLTQSAGFAGANGVFRLKPDGTIERAMAVAQVTNNQVQIIDPAPKKFRRGGF